MNLHMSNPPQDPKMGQKIAVIGSGISGSGAAWILDKSYDVTLYEQNNIAGGHTATVDIDYDGTPISVDTGFIVYNEANYPHLTALFDHLGIKTQESNMSFAVSRNKGEFEWGAHKWSMLLAQKRNIFRWEFLTMLREIMRFNGLCRQDRDDGHLKDRSIGEYLAWRGYSKSFQNNYLVPVAAAIWSSSAQKMLEFPATNFINFFENHRLVHRHGQDWRTVTGGSRNYLNKLHGQMKGRIKIGCGVQSVVRENGKSVITDSKGNVETYDHVIFACHTDQMLAILQNPTQDERSIAAAIPYSPNKVYLHRDINLMPKRNAVWGAWNYLFSTSDSIDADVSVSYWMNRLQNIDHSKPLFVSLNPKTAPKPDLTFKEFTYDHPQFGTNTREAHKILGEIQGQNNTWYAGAWTGNGFHEDGLRSAVNVANLLGAYAPWQKQEQARGVTQRADA
ncbi:FAD-dependent oxidoreductase [Lentilitoribacter sp. Alg239-R112]|uniref:NAD(P)/FAD-dependent oxidoreductase n=1 Tax=Lentilitoribacter sp. Alg239-R112 TaxID=2305987 RepID=UPI001FCF176C|nr:FAD-dependent oxidoreductase [Lentilitoribacter sp. Alg239-R112]